MKNKLHSAYEKIQLAFRSSKLNSLRRIRHKKVKSIEQDGLIESRVTMFGRRQLSDVKIVFDVGANDGFSFLYNFVKRNPSIDFVAFEPVPVLRKNIMLVAKDLKNYRVEPFAIDRDSKILRMGVSNVVEHGGGVSSLLEFKDTAAALRKDFYFEKFLEVQTISLERYLNIYNITAIDYLHIDAQGKDLDVLISLGAYISKVISGVVECADGPRGVLYKDQPTGEEIECFLIKNGFDIVLREYQGSEYNAYFIRKELNVAHGTSGFGV